MKLSPSLLASLLLSLWSTTASAKLNCFAGPSSPSCNLNGLLQVLYVIAVLLGIVLLVALAFAAYVWRRGKRTRIEDL